MSTTSTLRHYPASTAASQDGQRGHPHRGESVEILPQSSILCLDGGGIKGYSTLLILKVIMEEIYKILYSQQTNANIGGSANGHAETPTLPKPRDFFEYIIGTSSGGLIALMLGRLRMNVDQCLEAYRTLGDNIFGCPRWRHVRQIKKPFFWWPRSKYSGKKFESTIQGFIDEYEPGEGGSLHRPDDHYKTGVVAVIEFDAGSRPYLFRSYHHIDHYSTSTVLNPDYATKALIVQVARATSAAPTYFQHANLHGEKFVDGGLGNNNPSWIAYFEVIQMHELHRQRWREARHLVGQDPATPPESQPNPIGILVSIGTGKAKPTQLVGPAGVNRYLGYLQLTSEIATNSEAIHDRMVNTVSVRPGTHYHRFNVQRGLEDVKLDEWRTAKDAQGNTANITLQEIEAQTEAYLRDLEVMDEIRKCAQRLVDLRNAANR